jgi:hypothetical protein
MIMSTAKFRNMITEFKRYVRKETDWTNWSPGRGMKQLPKTDNTPEDRLIREMIDNVDFMVLYKSIEFRKQLRERLNYYGSN